MRLKVGTAAISAVVAMLATSPASADPYKFTLTGPFAAVWTIDSSPMPDEVGTAGDSFVVHDVSGNYSQIPGNENASVKYLADIQFYTDEVSGGFQIYNYYNDDTSLLTTDGYQLFTGTVFAPTFKIGSFALVDDNDEETSFNLTIEHAITVAAVPEPSTWAMMIGGLGIAGGALRLRKKKVTFQTAAA